MVLAHSTRSDHIGVSILIYSYVFNLTTKVCTGLKSHIETLMK